MSWYFDKDNNCTYEEWVARSGGLLVTLDRVCSEKKYKNVLELGAGNSTRVLAKRCDRVVTIDMNEDSIIVPVDEQKSLAKERWAGLKKEDNVEFICADILKLDFSVLMEVKPDLVMFDLGSTAEDKYLYRVCYDRLKANKIIDDNTDFILDNADMLEVKKFSKFLQCEEGYIKNGPGLSKKKIDIGKIISDTKALTTVQERTILYNIVKDIKPKTIVEIGVHRGGSFKIWSTLLADDGFIVGIEAHREYLELDTSTIKCNFEFVWADSTFDTTRDNVVSVLDGKEIDFLYIDASHDYNAVKADYELYSPLVRAGGIIGFHDAYHAPDGVGKFLDELKVPTKFDFSKSSVNGVPLDIAYVIKGDCNNG